MNIITAAQMQALDRRAMTEARIPGISLMEEAGKGLVTYAEQQFGPSRAKRVVIFAGKGNNGGDGFVVARLLHRHGARVYVLLLAPVTDLSRDATVMYRRFIKVAGKSAVVPFEV